MNMDLPLRDPSEDRTVHVVYAEFVVDLPTGMNDVSILLSVEEIARQETKDTNE